MLAFEGSARTDFGEPVSAIPASLHALLRYLPSHELLDRLEQLVGPEVADATGQRQPVGNPFLQPYAVHRLVGMFLASTGMMEAKQGARYHRVLARLRFLDKLPASWDVDPLVDTLPVIGSRPVPPCPDLPQGVEGPWPQNPVLHPGLYPPVMNLSREEEAHHLQFNVLRYLGQSLLTLPANMRRAASRNRLGELDDAQFASILQDTTYAQFIRSGLDPADIQAFRHLLKRDADDYYKIDFSIFEDMDPIDASMPQAGSVTLLERDSAGRFWPLAIQVGGEVLEPHHDFAWEIARYLVLHHAATQSIVIWHPRLHFPCDTVHAVTLSILPDGHPIKRLMLPHTPLTLGLHQAVMHNQRSVFHNNQREVFTPFAYTTASLHRAAARARAGIPGNRGYPAYRWGEDMIGDHVSYGSYRQSWADAFYGLCEGALAGVSRHDRHVAAWADHIASFITGFPDGSMILRGDNLVKAVSTWMRGVSTFHTADHYSIANIPLKWVPLRLRTPLPTPGMPRVERRKLLTREDRLRHGMAHELFIRPTVVYRLSDVRYGLPAGRPAAGEERFYREVAAIDEAWAGSGYPTSAEIGASIHY